VNYDRHFLAKEQLMGRIRILSIAAGLVFLVASCSPATTSELATTSQDGVPASEAAVPRVSLEETLAALESGEAIVVDVRGPEAYQASHIAGAISVPLGEIETNPNGLDLDKDQWIITYCT
jgi:3-mercaptopyruvate sulfurtransferase SseA